MSTTTCRAFLAHIPKAAWSRRIGDPALGAGKKVELEYPMIDDGPYQGLPIGGLGSGAIGRTYRGDFARWHTTVGYHRYEPAYANQFSLFVEQDGERTAQVLWPGRPSTVLQSWKWNYPGDKGAYYALFPRAWYVYEWEALPVRLVQEQFSPVIPHNYRESSYPVGIFEWTVENITDRPVRVGLMFTWENFLGSMPDRKQYYGNVNVARTEGNLIGIEMKRAEPFSGAPWDGSIALLTRETQGVTVTYRSRFAVDWSGEDVWNDFAADGQLDNLNDPRPNPDNTVGLAGALAVTFDLAPGERRVVPFALAWDQPVVEFPAGTRWYKYYTRFYGEDGTNAWRIAADALDRYPEWRRQIEAWQRPILEDPERPDWYKTALFNELYYLVDGGTLWVRGPLGDERTGEMGWFSYLECYDYPFYGTLDVAFYSSWSVLQLWPQLERQELLNFADTVFREDTAEHHIQATGEVTVRKKRGALPHDLGAPYEDPFLRPNAYRFQNINVWKDLNLKYVLRAYRDYVILNDRELLDRVWPTIPAALEYIRQFDTDGDGLLDHHGADQTYDTWAMEGASAYTAGLLIAALEAAAEMARIQGDSQHQQAYRAWCERARSSFQEKLWNGSYYLYNTHQNGQRDSIMADQLCGQWYAGALDLPPVAPPERIRQALKTVFEYNVMKFADGEMGAVNGMRPDGQVDTSSDQSQEVWSGVTYGLAALLLQEGLEEEAWRTAWGAYNVTYVTHGFWFRTPEAWRRDGRFRASMYMRPQAIWAIEYALRRRKANL